MVRVVIVIFQSLNELRCWGGDSTSLPVLVHRRKGVLLKKQTKCKKRIKRERRIYRQKLYLLRKGVKGHAEFARS